MLRGGGISHRRSRTGTSEAGQHPTPSQKPVTDPALPHMTMTATPQAPAASHLCVRRLPRVRRASPTRSGIALSRPRTHNLPLPGPVSETPRAPPIPIAGRRLRSIRLFHASRDRVAVALHAQVARRAKKPSSLCRLRSARGDESARAWRHRRTGDSVRQGCAREARGCVSGTGSPERPPDSPAASP